MLKIKHIYEQFLLSNGVSTDSREDVTNKIFFALSGDNFNGNAFASVAQKKGARLCVIDDSKFENKNSILVSNVLLTLQQLSMHHRKQSMATVLAITGTNGKTTTKELVAGVLGKFTDIIATKGNLNNHIGVPLTLLNIKPTTKIAVVEMGSSSIGEISILCNIAKPDVGIITNIGKAHLVGFGSLDGVISAKSELYIYLEENNGRVIVNKDDKLLLKLSKKISQFTYGQANADVTGKITENEPSLKITWSNNSGIWVCNSKLYGDYNFSNIMAAVASGLFFNVPPKIINNAIGNYLPLNNRSQRLMTEKNSIILDAYNANPTSMNEAIISFLDHKFANPYLLLGDMLELGSYSKLEHQAIVDVLLEVQVKNVILIGKEFKTATNHNYLTFTSTKAASNYLAQNSIERANILIKGSRGMKLENLLEML